MIIDTETHVLLRLWPIEFNPGQSRAMHSSWHEHSGELLVDEMDRAGVDKTFLISYDSEDILWYLERNGATAEDCIAGEKYTLSAVERWPDRFIWFATIKDPRRPDTLERIEDAFARGAVGIKVFPAYFPLDIDDPSFDPVWEACEAHDRRIILAFEDTEPPNTPSEQDYFRQLDRVLKRFPALSFQINHAGSTDPLAPDAEIIFEVTRENPNVLLSTSLLSMRWDDETEYPFPNYLRRLAKLHAEVGASKLMWATDWPWLEHFMKYPQAVNAIQRHAGFFSEEEKRAFMGGNAIRFLEGIGNGTFRSTPAASQGQVRAITGNQVTR
jgi:predicted TIM-barrel fold metal-dependent hydrolase